MTDSNSIAQLELDWRVAELGMVKDQENRELCLSLMKADTESEVIRLLSEAGYWDDERVWRFYGDYENNYNSIGNQQSSPDAALVEKLVNAVDSRLLNESLARGIDPQGRSAPKSIREAVAMFFEENPIPNRSTAGLVREWSDPKRTSVARGITLSATGFKPSQGKGDPCFTVSDTGEGQTPDDMPRTFLSLTGSNKLRIPFVQGKFNMGGTGVLKFCGKRGLQFILSRRNPDLVSEADRNSNDGCWGFTVVRRELPTGGRRSSVYTYLAPVNASSTPRQGGVLRFRADKMPIMADGQNAYSRESTHGTLVKLYEYATKSRTAMFQRGGVQERLDLLLTDLALPIRLHECRDFGGRAGSSFELTLAGIKVRLGDDKAGNLEEGFPDSSSLNVMGEEMSVEIYAFRKGKAKSYRNSEGILFTVNGQTHGHLTADFFRRNKVGLSHLRNDILVIVDCSKLTGGARENLFMNSRDRLSEDPLRNAIENELEDLLKKHPGLRELRERRRREEIASRLEDSRPLENVLESLVKRSPTLSDLLLQGKRIANPFKTKGLQEDEQQYNGKTYPTFFKFPGKEYGDVLRRNCAINRRCRITFETDAINDYFSRDVDRGEFALYMVAGGNRVAVDDYQISLRNGVATLSVRLPANCRVGDTLRFFAKVNDCTQIRPFENCFQATVSDVATSPPGTGGGRSKPPTNKPGKDREIPTGLALPEIRLVREEEWGEQDPPFNQYTALRITHAGGADENGNNGEDHDIYDFFINVDNAYLKNELKLGTQDPELIKAQFQYGLVLLGLGILHDFRQSRRKSASDLEIDDTSQSQPNIEDHVEMFTRAVAPMLLPMINSLGSLEIDGQSDS